MPARDTGPKQPPAAAEGLRTLPPLRRETFEVRLRRWLPDLRAALETVDHVGGSDPIVRDGAIQLTPYAARWLTARVTRRAAPAPRCVRSGPVAGTGVRW